LSLFGVDCARGRPTDGAVCGLVCDMPWPLRPLGVRELFEPGNWKRPDFSGLFVAGAEAGI
jgi:hypothetical protein